MPPSLALQALSFLPYWGLSLSAPAYYGSQADVTARREAGVAGIITGRQEGKKILSVSKK